MASLSIRNVSKCYGSVLAVANVSVEIEDGEFLVLVGPSGCGKSTLLRIIAGLEAIEDGSILIGGRDMSTTDPKDRDVAMVFQNYALYPHMTVFENMSFSLEQRRTPKAQIQKIVSETARILGLEGLVDRKPSELSGGQRQRVAMGRAIVRNPSVFLLDEPLSNLDAKLRVRMRSELKLLRSRLGVTTIYVTHDQTEAMTLGDRVAVLKPVSNPNETNLQQIDTPQNLYLRPNSLFVAGFIGSPAMNFLYADIENVGRGLSAKIAGTEHEIVFPTSSPDGNKALEAYSSKRVIMGIRPEFFSISQTPVENGSQIIPADILISELVGPDAYLHFDMNTPEVALSEIASWKEESETGKQSSRFVARVESSTLPRYLDGVGFSVAHHGLHFFDPDTGLAIN